MADPQADSSPTAPAPAAAIDLDLAFAADGAFAPERLAAAGPWADPLDGAEVWHGRITAWLNALVAELPPSLQSGSYSLGLQLCDDATIAELNATWRQKAGPTDVLAFAAQDDDLDGLPPMPTPSAEVADDDNHEDENPELDDTDALELGDIVISLDTAARQAEELGHSLERELQFLASHGLLHLLGWDHPDAASLAAMLARQERLLATP